MPGVTFNDFFGISVEGFWKDILADRTELVPEIKAKVLTQLAPRQWPIIISEISDKARELFNVDLVRVVASAWSKYRELAKYANSEKYPPTERNLVPLAKHTLTVTYHPYLELLFNGKTLGKVVFDIMLSLEMEGFLLTIQNGRIKKVHTGSCQGKGKIEFSDHVLMEKSLAKITLPGIIDLGEGIRLGKNEDKQTYDETGEMRENDLASTSA